MVERLTPDQKVGSSKPSGPPFAAWDLPLAEQDTALCHFGKLRHLGLKVAGLRRGVPQATRVLKARLTGASPWLAGALGALYIAKSVQFRDTLCHRGPLAEMAHCVRLHGRFEAQGLLLVYEAAVDRV